MNRRKAGTASILLGVLLLLGALGLTLYNMWDSARAAKASREIVEQLFDRIRENMGDDAVSGDTSSSDETAKEDTAVLATRPMEDPARTPYREMPTEEIDGYLYIGFLDIPSLELTLPVMAKWDYDRLKISPCRYSGSYYTDDLVICAHNYARHFSPIKWIDMGVDVYFTNVEGETIHYQTSNIQTVQPTHVDEMIENSKNTTDSSANWDMTLFTCNTGGQTRCAVRCTRVS